jgi:glucose/arabinose dehydrogenase
VGKEPEELKREIAGIREDLGETLDALAGELSPRRQAQRKRADVKHWVTRLRHAPMMDTALGALYRPLQPLTARMHLHRWRPRRYRPEHVLVPEGYEVEVVATGFNEPVHCCFDEQGNCYVIECGHKIEAKPRVLKVDVDTGESEVFFDLPGERWIMTGAVTGACCHDGHLYLMNTDTLSRITPDGRLEDLVTGLPGKGDHQSNYPVVGPDGKLHFGQGTYTNTGVVGGDDFAYGAYVPFGTETQAGEVIRGNVKCSGSVLRCNADGSDLELVAWGLRNPYGIAFAPDGRLFATEHGIDERSARHIIGDPEDFYEITEGAWYGWPDFASGVRLDDRHWGEGGRGREPVLVEHPDANPPKPFATFPMHAGPNGVDFCRDPAFGFHGDAFVALFGDLTPVTARLSTPSGFKVVRVDMRTREVVDFAVNKIQGPASRLPHAGFERPSHCQFAPDGALYVVDFGEVSIAPEKGGIRVLENTGALWRIRRTGATTGESPKEPLRVASYQLKAAAGGVVAAAAAVAWLVTRSKKRGRP